MSRIVAGLVLLIVASAAPAMAADEDEQTPSIGGPVVTITVDADQVKELVVTNVVLEPSAALSAGDVVRLTAMMTGGAAPTRTVLAVEGLREIEPNLPVAADGTIDYSFTVPDDLEPGSYDLTLRAEGLGAAPLGTLVVEQGPAVAAETPPTTEAEPTTEVEPTSAPQTDPAPPAALDEPAPSSDYGWAVPLVVLLIALATAFFVVWFRRRRNHEVPKVDRTASLPTATHVLAREPETEGESTQGAAPEVEASQTPAAPPPPNLPAEEDEPHQAPGPVTEAEETAEPMPATIAATEVEPPPTETTTDETSPPADLPANEDEPQVPEPVTEAEETVEPMPATIAATEVEPPPTEPTTDETSPPADLPANEDDEPGFVVVELTERPGATDEGDERESIVGEFLSAGAAKEAARAARNANDIEPPQEVWWEVRRSGGPAIWMIHAWAPREYDLDTKTRTTRSASTST